MTRSSSIRVVAAATLLAGAVACSRYGFPQVGVTKDASVVAGCEKVEDVSVSAKIPDRDVVQELSDEAGRKGANYVLVSSDNSRSGTAYRCSMPSTGASSSGGR